MTETQAALDELSHLAGFHSEGIQDLSGREGGEGEVGRFPPPPLSPFASWCRAGSTAGPTVAFL